MVKEEMHLQENTLFDLDVTVIQNVAQTLYSMWSMHLQSLKLLRPMIKRRCIYKKQQPFEHTHRQKDNRPTFILNILKKKADIITFSGQKILVE